MAFSKIFKNVRFIIGFYVKMLSLSWFGWPVQNIHFTDDNGYLPTVMNTNPFLPVVTNIDCDYTPALTTELPHPP